MNILMVLTSHDQLGDTGKKTGFWLEEFAAPYYAFKDAGADITLVSPQGGQPPLDPKSDEADAQTDATRRFKADPAAQARNLVARYRQNLPLTEPQMQASQKQVEEALFALGGIYNQQLREPARAVETYEKLVTRFPASVHSPETYYSLYLLYKELSDPKSRGVRSAAAAGIPELVVRPAGGRPRVSAAHVGGECAGGSVAGFGFHVL